jgi:WD40 repeat protein
MRGSATASTVGIWDAQADSEICVLQGRSDVVFSVAFPPNGRQVVSGFGDTTVRL